MGWGLCLQFLHPPHCQEHIGVTVYAKATSKAPSSLEGTPISEDRRLCLRKAGKCLESCSLVRFTWLSVWPLRAHKQGLSLQRHSAFCGCALKFLSIFFSEFVFCKWNVILGRTKEYTGDLEPQLTCCHASWARPQPPGTSPTLLSGGGRQLPGGPWAKAWGGTGVGNRSPHSGCGAGLGLLCKSLLPASGSSTLNDNKKTPEWI